MKRKNSFNFYNFFILDISISFSNEYLIKKVEITGNKRIPKSYITNWNKYFNKKITDEEINLITKILYQSDFWWNIIKKMITLFSWSYWNSSIWYIFRNGFFSDEQLKDVVKISKRDTFVKVNLIKLLRI